MRECRPACASRRSTPNFRNNVGKTRLLVILGYCILESASVDGSGDHHDAKTEAFALVNPDPSMAPGVAASGCQPPFKRGTLRGSMTMSEDRPFDTTPLGD